MLNKIISVIMSYVMSITGLAYNSFNGMMDSLSELVFGLPYSAQAVKDDFLSSIGSDDVEPIDGETGFVNDKIAVFVNSGASFREKLALFNSCGGRVVGWSTPADLYVIDYPEMTYAAVEAKCKALALNEAVELAIPVTASKLDLDKTPSDDFNYSNVYAQWDELQPEGRNWWLEAIDARQAWDYSEYFSKINIGIIDSGFDTDHPELSGKIRFPDEKSANRNRQEYHGCHVAGIIGAHHNGAGIAGICENSDLICVDWDPEFPQLWIPDLEIYFGFSRVVEAGAKVVNLSLGTSASKFSNSSTVFERLITPAAYSYVMSSLLAKGYDFVVVQSAGNGDINGNPVDAANNGCFTIINEDNVFTGSNNVSPEDIVSRIIVVASVGFRENSRFVQSSYTNVGERVDIAAPGDSVYSLSVDGGYDYLSGTSMAAPIVTAVASLVWSVNPEFTGAQVKEIVCTSTDSVAEINRSTPYIYDVKLMEYPVVNAKLSVEEAVRRANPQVGTVSGKIIGEADEIIYNGVSHTVFSDGTYSFVAPEGSGNATVVDRSGETLGSFVISIVAGETTEAGEYIIETNINTASADLR
ncbi:MAG: S8 family serine peptidase [Clostridia bacterium]|nr:S8 family serine peptidase [Clostridia bacterium]